MESRQEVEEGRKKQILSMKFRQQQEKKIIKGSIDSLCAQCGGTLLSIAGLSDSNNLGEAFLKVVDYYNEKNKRNNTTIKQEIEKRKHRYLNS